MICLIHVVNVNELFIIDGWLIHIAYDNSYSTLCGVLSILMWHTVSLDYIMNSLFLCIMYSLPLFPPLEGPTLKHACTVKGGIYVLMWCPVIHFKQSDWL